MTLLFALLLREVFEFRLVQTDPNFANYRYDPDSGQLILLDFGATRPYKSAIGYFDESTQDRHRQAILDMGEQAFEPFCQAGGYDFGATDLPARIREAGMALGIEREFWQLPPADAMLLQRKFGGLYLLAIRLKARVDLRTLAQCALVSDRHRN